MRLTPHVRLVASGAAGFDLTDALDCHVYLVEGARASALIDAGAGREAITVDTAEYLLLTHAHADHAGGAAGLAQRIPGLRVLAGPPADRWIATGDERMTSLDVARAGGTYPREYVFPACSITEPITDGTEIDLGGVTLTAIATPGHADGHTCYLLEAPGYRALFSGDCVFTGGRISLQNLHDCRIPEYARSLTRLAELDIDALFPGHHEISLTRAHRHLTAARDVFDCGLLPKSTT